MLHNNVDLQLISQRNMTYTTESETNMYASCLINELRLHGNTRHDFSNYRMLSCTHLCRVDRFEHEGWVSSASEADQTSVEPVHLHILRGEEDNSHLVKGLGTRRHTLYLLHAVCMSVAAVCSSKTRGLFPASKGPPPPLNRAILLHQDCTILAQ